MENIRITLETLYDLLRNEKKREDLQKLEATFFLDVVSYMREKKALLEMKHSSTELFAVGEKEKLEYELRSIKRILKEIYEKREKKIIDIALNRSRTGSDIIDTSSMLKEEREFYTYLLKNLDTYRKGILFNLYDGKLPEFLGISVPYTASGTENTTWSNDSDSDELPGPSAFSKFEGAPAMAADDEETASAAVSAPVPAAITPAALPGTRLRFIHPVPSFVWKGLKSYGPYDIGEEAELAPELADLLVRKGRAQKL